MCLFTFKKNNTLINWSAKKVQLYLRTVSVIPQAKFPLSLELSAGLIRSSFPLIGEGGTVLAGQGVLSAVTGGVVVLGVGLSWQRKTHLFHCLFLEEGM